ncbi:MAG: hypothetical protein J6P73_03075 [Bacteroidales bacterium]|nr:hypothetical protein [Bacteroidales bacterium]
MSIGFANIITGIIAGLITSISLSILIWKSKPRIKVSEKIAEENGRFRCKIQNNSNRDIGDTYIRVTFRTTNNGTHTYTTYCPILHSKKGCKDNFYYETRIRFNNAVWKNSSGGIDDRIELTIKEFFEVNNNDSHCCVELEISYYDYNLIYGAIRRFEKRKYTKESIEYNTIFPEGSLTPVPATKKPQDKSES